MITTTTALLGNNALGSGFIFLYRDLYDKEVLPKEYYNYSADLWKEKLFYGKVDERNNAIFPSEAFLKRISANNNREILVLDFVADAFKDLQQYYISLTDANKLATKSQYYNLEPARGWQSFHTNYDLYVKSFVKAFYENKLAEPSSKKKIFGFYDLFKIFIEFLDERTGYFCFNRSTYANSIFVSPNISGLMIELSETTRYDDDYTKVNNFINDPNFDTFLDAAKRYGFMVDKNAPWRIIADLESPAMLQYLKKYGLNNKEDVFKKRFYKAFYTDIEVLKVLLKQVYNTYVSSTPLTFVDKLSQCDKIIIESFEIKEIGMDQFAEYCNDYYLNRLYIYIKAKETLKKWDQNTFEKIVLNANEILRYKGKESSLVYINSQFTDLENLIVQRSSLTEDNPDVILQIKQQFQQPKGFKF